MAFASTLTDRASMGNKLVHYGTFASSGGDQGGDINTGLLKCEHIQFTANAAAVGNDPVVNETLPVDGSAVTIVTDANEVGYWMAIGY
jgi:hypothetical protein